MTITAAEQSQSLRQALRQDSERRKLEAIAVRDSVRIGRNLSMSIMRAYRLHEAFAPAIESALEDFTTLLTDTGTASHMLGATRSIMNAQAALRRQVAQQRALAVTVYDEALRFMQNRLDLSAEDVVSISQTYSSAAIEVTRSVGAVAELSAQKAAAKIVSEGMHVNEGMTHMRSALETSGVTGAQPHLLETLVRTQAQLGYGAGRWAANQDEAIDEILWGYRYVTVGDDRVRPNHALLDYTQLEKSSSQWDTIWPPNGFRCRCTTTEIYKSDYASQVKVPSGPPRLIEGKTVIPQPDKGFAFNPGKVHQTTATLVSETVKTQMNKTVAHTIAQAAKTPDEVLAQQQAVIPEAHKMSLADAERAVDDEVKTVFENARKQMQPMETGELDLKAKLEHTISRFNASQREQFAKTKNYRKTHTIEEWMKSEERRVFTEEIRPFRDTVNAAREKYKALVADNQIKRAELLFGKSGQTIEQKFTSGWSRYKTQRDHVRTAFDRISRTASPRPDAPTMHTQSVKVHVASRRASADGLKMKLRPGGKTETIGHEFGHVVEERSAQVHKRALEFFEKRTTGESTERLRDIFPGQGYGADEITKKNKFMHAYSGRVYRHGGRQYATEVLSMGIEHVMENPFHFFATDYDHFRFTVAIMKGLI